MEKKTPLYDAHEAAGGKIVPFAGYLLPVQYTGVIEEHEAVRTKCGLFDVSHMGEVVLSGPGALATMEHVLTNSFENMPIGKCRYSALCQDDGGMLDDLIVYRLAEDSFYVVVNAANRERDVAWLKEHLLADTQFEDLSESIAQLAIQGPLAPEITKRVCNEDELPRGYYTFTRQMEVAGRPCLVSRTGYTGELGYEIYCAPGDAQIIWDALLEAGGEDIVPCGLGARDTLRLEAAMPLYGHEMDTTVTPLETGLAFGVNLDKEDFIGKAAILAKGTPRERVGLKVTGRGIAREQCPVFVQGRQIGATTSGTFCPHLKGAYAMALVEAGTVAPGDEVLVEVRGRALEAEVVPLPFYKRGK